MKNSKKDKTIKFQDKKELKISNGTRSSKYNTSYHSHKVIPYKRKSKKNHKKNMKKYKLYILQNKTIVIIFSMLILTFIVPYFFNNNLPNNSNKTSSVSTTKYISENPTISQSDFQVYSDITSKSVKSTLNLTTASKVVTESIHKNGNKFYSSGYFYIENDMPIYFDVILKGKDAISLVVNGSEYIK